jgi:hypothetical protein
MPDEGATFPFDPEFVLELLPEAIAVSCGVGSCEGEGIEVLEGTFAIGGKDAFVHWDVK